MLGVILQRINLSNEEFAKILSEGGYGIKDEKVPPRVTIDFLFAQGKGAVHDEHLLPTDLTASSVLLWNSSVGIAAILAGLPTGGPIDLSPPQVIRK
jgi:hypothetical protein